jgi:hypothetical protein
LLKVYLGTLTNEQPIAVKLKWIILKENCILPDLSPTIASSYAFPQELWLNNMIRQSGNSNPQAI